MPWHAILLGAGQSNHYVCEGDHSLAMQEGEQGGAGRSRGEYLLRTHDVT